MNLFIDTHLNDVIVILSENGRILKEKKIINEKQNSTIVMPLIKKLLGSRIPETIIVVNGPGSFTGVRLGVTIAKTLAYTLNVPIYTITSLECIALNVEEDDKIVGFCDKNGYYIGIFNNDYNIIGKFEYLSNSEFEEFSKKYNVHINVNINYEKIINYTLTKKTINPHEVNPIYVKKIDVEK